MKSKSITVFGPRTYSRGQRGVPILEAPLQEAAVAAADQFAPTEFDLLVVIPELEIAGMRPDLWIGHFDEDVFRARLDADIQACTAPYPLAIALILRRLGPTTIDRLCQPSGGLGDRRRVQRGVTELVERGVAVREEDAIVLSPLYRSAEARGVAVEAKVNRWRKAARQAQMWRRFVSGTWLMFPTSYLSSVPRQAPAIRGMGLAVFDGEEASVIRRPRLTRGRAYGQLVLEEHIYARWRAEHAPATKRGPTRPASLSCGTAPALLPTH